MHKYSGYCATRWIAIVTCERRSFSGSSGGIETTPKKIDHVARRRGVQISGERHQDKEQVEDKVREGSESDFEPGEDRRQRWRRAVPTPPGAEYHRRKNSQSDGAVQQQEEIALRGAARCPGDGPTERDCDESECGDEPMHRLCDAVVGRGSARRGGAGRLRSWHGS
jgi:hypothetical protein